MADGGGNRLLFWSIVISIVMLVGSVVLWALAVLTGWIDSVEFVSHVSMLALVYAAVVGVIAALAELEASRRR